MVGFEAGPVADVQASSLCARMEIRIRMRRGCHLTSSLRVLKEAPHFVGNDARNSEVYLAILTSQMQTRHVVSIKSQKTHVAIVQD